MAWHLPMSPADGLECSLGMQEKSSECQTVGQPFSLKAFAFHPDCADHKQCQRRWPKSEDDNFGSRWQQGPRNVNEIVIKYSLWGCGWNAMKCRWSCRFSSRLLYFGMAARQMYKQRVNCLECRIAIYELCEKFVHWTCHKVVDQPMHSLRNLPFRRCI